MGAPTSRSNWLKHTSYHPLRNYVTVYLWPKHTVKGNLRNICHQFVVIWFDLNQVSVGSYYFTSFHSNHDPLVGHNLRSNQIPLVVMLLTMCFSEHKYFKPHVLTLKQERWIDHRRKKLRPNVGRRPSMPPAIAFQRNILPSLDRPLRRPPTSQRLEEEAVDPMLVPAQAARRALTPALAVEWCATRPSHHPRWQPIPLFLLYRQSLRRRIFAWQRRTCLTWPGRCGECVCCYEESCLLLRGVLSSFSLSGTSSDPLIYFIALPRLFLAFIIKVECIADGRG